MSDKTSGRKRRSGAGKAVVPADTLPARVGEFAGFMGKVAERLAANARASGLGGKAAEQLRKAEQGLLRTLRQRMDDAGRDAGSDRPEQATYVSSDGSEVSRTFVIPVLQSPKRILEDLLQRSIDQTRDQAEEDLYALMLSDLVPDEARILSLLSSGEPQALMHIGVGSPFGTPGRRVAENFCSVGRPAQVKLQDCVPLYDFRAAMAQARDQTRLSVRVVRRTVVISKLGRRLWATCTEGQQAAGESAGFSASPLSAIRQGE